VKFQILISTVNRRFLKRDFSLRTPHLIVNQQNRDEARNSSVENLFNYDERGLSKSRNHALDHAEGKICLISDDDLTYKEDIESIILHSFEQHPDADIITFQIETPDGQLRKKYRTKPYWHNKRTVMKVSSVEITFKKSAIDRSHLRFDENFGLGAAFPTGEENIFLSDALDKGLKILAIPIPIVSHPMESSGKNFDSRQLIQAKGALFERIFGLKSYAVSFLFAYRKYKMSKFSLFAFYDLMLRGARTYRHMQH